MHPIMHGHPDKSPRQSDGDPFWSIVVALHRLAAAVRAQAAFPQPFDRLEAQLATLPLRSIDFVVTRARLRHARALVDHGQPIAASRELKLVADCLATLLPPAVEYAAQGQGRRRYRTPDGPAQHPEQSAAG